MISPAHAERATARYAPVQLEVARSALERAQRLVLAGKTAAARRLALQAATDARVAWAMSDSPYLRGQAAALYRRSAQLDMTALTMKEEP